jgi:hypothetical protein
MEPITDLHDELAHLFRNEPVAPPVSHFVETGHRRLRRQRLGRGIAAAVLSAGTLTGAYAVATAGTAAEPGLVATPSGTLSTTPTPTPSPSTTETTETPAAAESPYVQQGIPEDFGEPVDVDKFGHYTLRPGYEVVDSIDNPYHLEAPYSSAALDVAKGRDHVLVLVTPGAANYTAPGQMGPGGEITLAHLADANAAGCGWEWSSTSHGLANRLSRNWYDVDVASCMPTIGARTEVLAQVDDPLGLGERHQSVAYTLSRDGLTWWALWERSPTGRHAHLTLCEAGDGYASLDEWLADQTARLPW